LKQVNRKVYTTKRKLWEWDYTCYGKNVKFLDCLCKPQYVWF